MRTMSHESYIALGPSSDSLSASSQGRRSHCKLEQGRESSSQQSSDIWTSPPAQELPADSPPSSRPVEKLQTCPTSMTILSQRTMSSTKSSSHNSSHINKQKLQKALNSMPNTPAVTMYVNIRFQRLETNHDVYAPCSKI